MKQLLSIISLVLFFNIPLSSQNIFQGCPENLEEILCLDWIMLDGLEPVETIIVDTTIVIGGISYMYNCVSNQENYTADFDIAWNNNQFYYSTYVTYTNILTCEQVGNPDVMVESFSNNRVFYDCEGLFVRSCVVSEIGSLCFEVIFDENGVPVDFAEDPDFDITDYNYQTIWSYGDVVPNCSTSLDPCAPCTSIVCEIPDNAFLFTSDQTVDDIELHFNRTGYINYDWRYKLPGSNNWTYLGTTTEPDYFLSDLPVCGVYYFEVRLQCVNGEWTDWINNGNDGNDSFEVACPEICIDASTINLNIQCSDNYVPVCGCDGRTYPNACIAENYYGITDYTAGSCDEEDCIDPSLVSDDPCPLNYDPVCGCNGVTYFNDCSAGNSGVIHWTAGECSDNCNEGILVGVNVIIECEDDYAPVCGCNGETYPNECYALADGIVDYVPGSCPILDCDSIIYVPLPYFGSPENPLVIDECSDFPDEPVCGCDGITYINPCYATANGVAYYTDGSCDDDGGDNCVNVINEDIFCPLNYDPICGCDGVTYPNPCFAENYYGITNYTRGPCDIDDCIDPDLISDDYCPFNYDPVCGCDGVTYANECSARNSGLLHWTQGECGSTCQDPILVDANLGQFCPQNYAPVCGCNGETYPNECYALADGVKDYVFGPCPELECDSLVYVPLPIYGDPTHPAVIEECDDYGNNPVCGCDDITYQNPCYATANGVESYTYGSCEDEDDCVGETYENIECFLNYDPVCGCDGQMYPNSCSALLNGIIDWEEGPCSTCNCPNIWDPVCGSDGVTYPNSCLAMCAGVSSEPGECPGEDCVLPPDEILCLPWIQDIISDFVNTYQCGIEDGTTCNQTISTAMIGESNLIYVYSECFNQGLHSWEKWVYSCDFGLLDHCWKGQLPRECEFAVPGGGLIDDLENITPIWECSDGLVECQSDCIILSDDITIWGSGDGGPPVMLGLFINDGSPTPDTYRWEYRIENTSTWVLAATTISPTATIYDLEPCTTYFWRVVVICGDDMVISDSIWMTTDCSDCELPNVYELSESNVSQNSAILDIDQDDYSMYEWRYRLVGSSTWENTSLTSTSNRLISNLIPCRDYEWQLRVRCTNGEWSIWLEIQQFQTECEDIDLPDCPVLTDILCLSWLQAALEDHLSNDCENLSVELKKATWQNQDVLIFSFFDPDFPDGGAIDEYYDCEGTLLQTCTGFPAPNFCTPDPAPIPFFELSNIQTIWDCTDGLPDCFDCQLPNVYELSESNVSQTSAILDIDQGDYSMYEWRYRLVDSSTWENTSLTSTSNRLISNLIPCRDYEWQLRVRCTNGEWSIWLEIQQFQTECEDIDLPDCPVLTDILCLSWLQTALEDHLSNDCENLSVELKKATWQNQDVLIFSFFDPDFPDGGAIDEYYDCEGTLLQTCTGFPAPNFCTPDPAPIPFFELSNIQTIWNCTDGLPGCSDCELSNVYELSEMDVSQNSAILDIDQDDYSMYEWRYRLVGSSTWENTNLTSTSNRLISNLIPCSEYEWQVRGQCTNNNEWTDWSETANFMTIGCSFSCETPPNIEFSTVSLNQTNATFWVNQDNYLSYDWRYRRVGSGWIDLEPSNTQTKFVSELTACENYEWQVNLQCVEGEWTGWLATQEFRTLGCPDDPFILILPDVQANQGDQVCLPLTVEGFINIIGMQFSVNYDANALSYTGAQNLNTGLLGWSSGSIGNPSPGNLTFTWNDPLASGVSLSNGTTIVELCFTVNASSGTTILNFSSTPTVIEIVDGDENTLNLSSQNGSVAVNGNSNLPSFYFTPVNQTWNPGDQFSVDVWVSGFSDIASIQFPITWNSDIVSFESLSNINSTSIPGLSMASFGTPEAGPNGQLVLSWNHPNFQGTTIADGTILFTINFQGIGEGTTDVEFNDTLPQSIEILNPQGVNLGFSGNSGSITISSQACILSTEEIICLDWVQDYIENNYNCAPDACGGLNLYTAPNGDCVLDFVAEQACLITACPAHIIFDLQGNQQATFGSQCNIEDFGYTLVQSLWDCTQSLPFCGSLTPPWIVDTTTLSHIVILPTNLISDINANTIQIGDYLGFFYEYNEQQYCAGFGRWTGSTAVTISVYGNDAITPAKNGFDLNETFNVKVWQVASQEEIPVFAEYLPEDGGGINATSQFIDDGTSVIAEINTGICLQIDLEPGVQFISSYVLPRNTSMIDLISEISDDMIEIKNDQGQAIIPLYDIYDPLFTNWIPTEGYKIKMENSASLEICGSKIDPFNTPIPINEGVQWIAYLRDQESSPITQMASAAECIYWLKNDLGQGYLPAFPPGNMEYMEPTEGYKLRASCSSSIQFTQNLIGGSNGIGYQVELGNTGRTTNLQHFNEVSNTGKDATLVIPVSAIENTMQIGDEIGVFTQDGILSGAAVYEGNNFYITIWGDAPETPIKEGPIELESYQLRIWNQQSDEEFSVDVILEEGNAEFIEDIQQIVQQVTIITDSPIVNNDIEWHMFPNPANDKLSVLIPATIRGNPSVDILSSNGKLLKTLPLNHSGRSYYANILLDNIPSGLYWCRLKTEHTVSVKKLVVVK